MEEGIFPSYRSVAEQKELEEERRLCYVGITRAREYIYLTCARLRTIFGSTSCNKISRFIEEIPKEMREGYDETNSSTKEEFKDSNVEWIYNSANKGSILGTGSKKSEYNFRTAESFLNNLNTEKRSATINNSVGSAEYKVGQKVSHKKFGIGIINSVQKEGDDFKVDITFEKSGHKRLMAKFANLEMID